MNLELIRNNFNEALELLAAFSTDEKNIKAIADAGEQICEAFLNDKKLMTCGNGGSMSDAIHFAEELSGRFRSDRPALPALAISDAAHITCTANDYGFEKIFSRYIEGVGKTGDVLVVISTSGNSENILQAVTAARKKGICVIGLTGKDGGKLGKICDVEINVPHHGYADRIQEVHIQIIHSIIQYIEQKLFQ